MIANKYEAAKTETKSVLSEWLVTGDTDRLAGDIVQRLIAKGIIQDTNPDELVEPQYRTGPMAPGRTIVGP